MCSSGEDASASEESDEECSSSSEVCVVSQNIDKPAYLRLDWGVVQRKFLLGYRD